MIAYLFIHQLPFSITTHFTKVAKKRKPKPLLVSVSFLGFMAILHSKGNCYYTSFNVSLNISVFNAI